MNWNLWFLAYLKKIQHVSLETLMKKRLKYVFKILMKGNFENLEPTQNLFNLQWLSVKSVIAINFLVLKGIIKFYYILKSSKIFLLKFQRRNPYKQFWYYYLLSHLKSKFVVIVWKKVKQNYFVITTESIKLLWQSVLVLNT